MELRRLSFFIYSDQQVDLRRRRRRRPSWVSFLRRRRFRSKPSPRLLWQCLWPFSWPDPWRPDSRRWGRSSRRSPPLSWRSRRRRPPLDLDMGEKRENIYIFLIFAMPSWPDRFTRVGGRHRNRISVLRWETSEVFSLPIVPKNIVLNWPMGPFGAIAQFCVNKNIKIWQISNFWPICNYFFSIFSRPVGIWRNSNETILLCDKKKICTHRIYVPWHLQFDLWVFRPGFWLIPPDLRRRCRKRSIHREQHPKYSAWSQTAAWNHFQSLKRRTNTWSLPIDLNVYNGLEFVFKSDLGRNLLHSTGLNGTYEQRT